MIELVILSHLIHNEEFTRKSLPYLKTEYFNRHDTHNVAIIFGLVEDFIKKYNALPTREALYIDLSNKENLNTDQYKECQQVIAQLDQPEKTDLNYLLKETEKWVQERAIHIAVSNSIEILGDKSGKLSKGAIPQLLSDALMVSFDTSIGHDFLENYEERYDFYHEEEFKVPFDLEYLNKITRGGAPRKTLTVILAGPGVGKTMCMCHCAAANLCAGHNVLYITLEMAQERIAERIDANLLNVPIDNLVDLSRDEYNRKVERLKERTQGKLIIKEYPTTTAGSNHFRALLNELKLKKNFVPDIIYIDYLNICISSRIKQASDTYYYVKTIADELRGIAVEYNVPVITGSQFNRQGMRSSDPEMDNVSESIGTGFTADFMWALISDEKLEGLNQILVKQLKNRYGDKSYKRFVIGVDRSRMRLYDVEETAQEDVADDDSVFGQVNKDQFKDFK